MVAEYAVAVVRMDVHAGVGSKQLRERVGCRFEPRLAPEVIETVEFDDDQPATGQQPWRGGQKRVVFRPFDVELEQQVAAEIVRARRHPGFEGERVTIVDRADEPPREVEAWMAYGGRGYRPIGQEDLHAEVATGALEPAIVPDAGRPAGLDAIQVGGDDVATIAIASDPSIPMAALHWMKLTHE